MDALSNVLKSVRLEGAVFLNAEFTAPWCILSRFGQPNILERLAGAEHVMYFHFLTAGSCRLRLANGGDTLELSEGDVALFPQDGSHLMGTDLRLPAVGTDTLLDGEASPGADFVHMRHGGGGAVTRFVCGYLACSRSVSRLLLDGLPGVVRISIGDTPAASLIRESLRVGVRESTDDRPGSASLLAKLSELMFVEAMRRYVETLPPGGSGWLAGVRDAQVGRALGLLHAHPQRAWTVDQLARDVALSRSALADRFTALVGEPPIQYLQRWRLALAAQSLRQGRETIARVAERSGYESEAAFNRAFKREFGMPPATWRRAHTGRSSPAG